MNTAQLLLISSARQGEPQAIARLIQHELQHQGIEVCGWKKGTTLHLELMGQTYPTRSEMLKFIGSGLSFLRAEGIEAARIVAYVEGEDHPRWVDRIGLSQRLRQIGPAQANRPVQTQRSPAAWGLGIGSTRFLKGAAIACAATALSALGFSLSLRSVTPSYAEQRTEEASRNLQPSPEQTSNGQSPNMGQPGL